MFLYNATGHVDIGSKFNKQGPPAQRLDVDGNTKLKGTLFFDRPVFDEAYADASGNAIVVPDGEAQSLVVRATGGAAFFTLDSSDQHVRVHSPLRFFGGSSSKILLPSDTANALALDTYTGSPLATVQTSEGNEKLQLHMNLAFTSGDSFYGVDHAIEIESQESVALKVGTATDDYLHFDTKSGPSVAVDQDLRVVSGRTVRVEDNQVSQSTSTGAFSTAGGIGVQRNAYIGGVVTVTDETPSFNTATGSIVTSGGLGVAKDTHVGGDLDVAGDAVVSKDLAVMYGLAVTQGATIGNKLEVQDTTKAGLSDGTAAAMVIKGGMTVKENSIFEDTLSVESDLAASFYSLASVTLKGGLGVEKNIITGGDVEVQSSTASSGSSSGALKVTGGLGVGANGNFAGKVVVEDTTQATSLTDASLATKGGIYVQKDAIVAGDVEVSGAASFSSAVSALYGLTVQQGATISGSSSFTDTTETSSSTTGALTVSGGLGVAKKVNVGDKFAVADNTVATSATSASATFAGGVGVSENIITGGAVDVQSTTQSTGSSTGALKVSGGLGVGSDWYFGGKLVVEDATDSTSSTSGALVVTGGLGVSKEVHFGDKLSLSDSTTATSTTSASATFAGGVGVSENIITGGAVEVQSTAQSTSSSSGALKVSGGLGVGANGNFAGKIFVEDDTQATSATSASLVTDGGIYAAKDVIVNGGLVTSEVSSPATTALDISSNGALNMSSSSGSDINIESGGDMTLRADKLTVETETPSSTSTPHLSLLDGYMNILKKQVSVTSSYVTIATVELSYLKSCHVKVVLEGNWANNPALGTFEFLVMHNGGSDPEPGATNTSDSSQTLTGLVVEQQFVVDTSGANYYTGVVTAENSGTSAKDFYVKFKAEGSSVGSSSSFTTNAVVTVSGSHSSVA